MKANPITISLCMIVKNEEDVIARCLESVQEIADEIIIVDTGSTDRTKEIVRAFTDKVYDFTWINHFAAARNYSFSLATMEYILWLDADDIILEPDRQRFLELKHHVDPAVDSISMHYHLCRDCQGNVTSSLRRNRLVKRSKQFQWIGAVHEYLAIHGHVLNSDIAVTHSPLRHDADRNINIYQERLAAGEQFTPRDLYYYANELRDHGKHTEAIEYYQKFLDTKQGWIEDNIAACGKMADSCLAAGDRENYLKYALRSFEYDLPRAEFLCRLGYYFLLHNRIKESIFWYKLATQLEKNTGQWATVDHACWTWLPHLQLCVCYDKLGQHELASLHNELAAAFIPNDPRILYNRQYFSRVLNKSAAEAIPTDEPNGQQAVKLHLGCGRTILEGWINLDCVAAPGVDVVADLDQCATQPLPFEDNSVAEFLGSHLIEHIRQPLPMMQELYRIAGPNAKATFILPYGSSDDAFEDPTHVRQYFLQSFGYFSQPYYWRADYGYRGDWLTKKITLKLPAAYRGKDRQDILRDIMSLRNVISAMTAEMIAVKPARPPKKELQIAPVIEFDFV